MAWRVAKVEEHRKEFIEQINNRDRTITDLCNEYQVSRKTAYKWIHRYQEKGEEGLKDKSRSPHSQPRKTDDRLIQRILEVKNRYPSWGPKKILGPQLGYLFFTSNILCINLSSVFLGCE